VKVARKSLRCILRVFAVANFHWYWELEYQTPAARYALASPINVGQHNMAFTPGAAFTITPHHALKEVSARFNYVINGPCYPLSQRKRIFHAIRYHEECAAH